MSKSLWVIRILFLLMCGLTGYAVSQTPDLSDEPLLPGMSHPVGGIYIGCGIGAILIGIDEMLKGFSLRAFSATVFR